MHAADEFIQQGRLARFEGHAEEALPWLLSSIAITPASGRSYMLLSAAYEELGRLDEAIASIRHAIKAFLPVRMKSALAAKPCQSGWARHCLRHNSTRWD